MIIYISPGSSTIELHTTDGQHASPGVLHVAAQAIGTDRDAVPPALLRPRSSLLRYAAVAAVCGVAGFYAASLRRADAVTAVDQTAAVVPGAVSSGLQGPALPLEFSRELARAPVVTPTQDATRRPSSILPTQPAATTPGGGNPFGLE